MFRKRRSEELQKLLRGGRVRQLVSHSLTASCATLGSEVKLITSRIYRKMMT